MSSLRERILDQRRGSGFLDSPRLSSKSRYPSLPLLSLSVGSSHTLPKHFGRELLTSSSVHLVHDEIQPPAYVRPAHSSLPHEGFSARNHEWASVQRAIVSLFQQKKLSNVEMTLLCENVRAISNSELGPFIYDYYKNQLMPRGVRILRDRIELLAKEKGDIIASLCEVWDIFYQEILPLLQVVLRPIQIKDHSVRNVTLLGFRDIVLLKIDIQDALGEYGLDAPPAIKQMLLILQSIKDCTPPSENYLSLERLVARVVDPYLGYCGLYTKGNPEPKIKSAHPTVIMRNKEDKAPLGWFTQTQGNIRNVKSHNRLPSASALIETTPLEPVMELIPNELKKHPRQAELSRKVSDTRRHSLSEIMG